MILVEIFFYAIITKKLAKRRVFIVAGAGFEPATSGL